MTPNIWWMRSILFIVLSFTVLARTGTAQVDYPIPGSALSVTEDQMVAEGIQLLKNSLHKLSDPTERDKVEKAIRALEELKKAKKPEKGTRFRKKNGKPGVQAETSPEGIGSGEGGEPETISTPTVGGGGECITIVPGEFVLAASPQVGSVRIAGLLAHEGTRLRQNASYPLDEKKWTEKHKCLQLKNAIEALTVHKAAAKAVWQYLIDQEDEKRVAAGNWYMAVEKELDNTKAEFDKRNCKNILE